MTNSQNPYFWLACSDALDWLRGLADESVNLLVTDVPYESLEKHRKHGTTTRLKVSKASSNEWFDIFPNEKFEELFSEVHRVLVPDAHFYFYCDQETMFVAKPIAEQYFKFWKPIVWDKKRIGMGYHYRCRYEFVLFFEKGKRRLNNLGIGDVLSFDGIRGGYPTEKPVELNEVFVQQSSIEGEIVADPFMGSGSAGVAAVRNNRNFWGNDLKPEAVSLAKSRLLAINGREWE